jgi:endoglucanase
MYRQSVLPRWRGFNLDLSQMHNGRYREQDFALIAELGFNFVRLPLSYRAWIDNDDPFAINCARLSFVDEALSWGELYGLHVCLAFQRAPGFPAFGSDPEPFRLFEQITAQACFWEHWSVLARRYKAIPSSLLSFNLLNAPCRLAPREHAQVMRSTVACIRKIDTHRLILLDGLNAGAAFPTDLFDLGKQNVAFCTHGAVLPNFAEDLETDGLQSPIETETCSWHVEKNPLAASASSGGFWERQRLEQQYRVWAAIAEAANLGVLCSDCGSFEHVPRPFAMHWMCDLLEVLKELNIGYALPSLRGPSGILDSGRADGDYQDFHGHQLDRGMIEILRRN